jgi:hypothetical protein
MAVGQETKRKIIELYFTQHKNIREIAKEVQKSSRDIVTMVMEISIPYSHGLTLNFYNRTEFFRFVFNYSFSRHLYLINTAG